MVHLRENTRHPLWRRPKHYMDLPSDQRNDHVHWIELFYDLVHVVAVFVLGNYLSHHLDMHGFLVFAGVFAVMWLAWLDNSWFNSIYVSTDIYHRLTTTGLIMPVLMSSASIADLDGEGWGFFALAFAVHRLMLGWLYFRAKKIGDSLQCFPGEMARNYMILAVVYALSAFLPKPWAFYVFVAGWVWHTLWFIVPKIGVLRFERNEPRHGHLAERFALLMLIVSGEGFFKLVLTLDEKGIYKLSPEVFVNYVIGAMSIFALCWIYYDYAGNAKPKDRSNLTLYSWMLAHLFLMLSTVMVGVAVVGEVKVGFFEPFPLGYGLLGCVGVLLFLLMLTVIQKLTEERTADAFTLGWERWFGIGMAVVALLTFQYVPAILGNLIWGTALFSQIVIPVVRGVRTFEREGDW